ncbi:hypothetical protein TYRP_007046 [Tyrophagus putrescentiae]|nr:hypothetical protein TYRP_007046 [Tyrophagus putrescentiae]
MYTSVTIIIFKVSRMRNIPRPAWLPFALLYGSHCTTTSAAAAAAAYPHSLPRRCRFVVADFFIYSATPPAWSVPARAEHTKTIHLPVRSQLIVTAVTPNSAAAAAVFAVIPNDIKIGGSGSPHSTSDKATAVAAVSFKSLKPPVDW